MMKMILSRHGNTFNPGETAVWVGSRNDLPLVETGFNQAKILASCLQQARVYPSAIYCGPLQRTQVYAQIIVKELKLPSQPIVDERLNEIDYGVWTGLSNQQIRSQFGAQELEAWEKHSQWPSTAHWDGSAELLNAQINSFCNDIIQQYSSNDTILIISSNGRLRYFLNLAPGEFEQQLAKQTVKVATGNICQLSYNKAQWKINYWNQAPSAGLNNVI